MHTHNICTELGGAMKFTELLDRIAEYIDERTRKMEKAREMGHLIMDEKFDKKLGLPQITGKNPYRWM